MPCTWKDMNISETCKSMTKNTIRRKKRSYGHCILLRREVVSAIEGGRAKCIVSKIRKMGEMLTCLASWRTSSGSCSHLSVGNRIIWKGARMRIIRERVWWVTVLTQSKKRWIIKISLNQWFIGSLKKIGRKRQGLFSISRRKKRFRRRWWHKIVQLIIFRRSKWKENCLILLNLSLIWKVIVWSYQIMIK